MSTKPPLPTICDLHCDLLSYLAADPERSALDSASRASLPQLEAGGVRLQTLAIFAETGVHPPEWGESQIEAMMRLPQLYPGRARVAGRHIDLSLEGVAFIAALESASALCGEEEPLAHGLARMERALRRLGRLFYISLTWNGENRFGGGCGSSAGLKADGRTLLQWMSGKGVALDLSHAADRLAFDCLDFIAAHSLALPVMASHSNFRAVVNHERNLPDELIDALVASKGIVGLNFYRKFAPSEETLLRHMAYGLEKGVRLSFGADFFYPEDFAGLACPKLPFLERYGDARCYPHLLQDAAVQLGLTAEACEEIAWKHAAGFLAALLPLPVA